MVGSLVNAIIYHDEVFVEIDDSILPGVWPHKYMISNYGTLRDLEKEGRFGQKSFYMDSAGYLSASFKMRDGSYKNELIHRLVGYAFIPGDRTLQINHKDGHKNNECYRNLEWTTPRENLIHAIQTGLHGIGEDKPNAILTNEQARIICECLQNQCTFEEILRRAGLEDTDQTRGMVVDIKRGKSFAFISKDYNFSGTSLREREFDNGTVRAVCLMKQNDPTLSPAKALDMVMPDCDPKRRLSLRNKIGSIFLRKAYQNISKDYIW